jgi:hypothetical protein
LFKTQEILKIKYMPTKLTVNQRVRELINSLGFGDNVEGFHKRYFGEGRSEKLRNVLKDANLIKTDFLVEIAENIVQIDGKKVNLNYILTGDGELFLQADDRQQLIDTQRELLSQYRARIAKLEETIRDLEDRLSQPHN